MKKKKTAAEIDWQQLCQIISTDELWSVFKSKIQSLTEAAVPQKSHQRKKAKPWFSKRIKKEVDLRDVAWREYQRIESESSYVAYKQQRNRAPYMLRKARETFENELVASSKRIPRKIFAHLQSNR